MSKLRFRAISGLVVLLAACATVPVAAQTAAPSKTAAVAADAQKSAFLAMGEPDRKAVQDALGWLGLYNGVVDGGYGKRTLDAILAYQTNLKAPADGVVTSPQLASLKASAAAARAAVGFSLVDDSLTGVRIGAPLKLLDKKSAQGEVTRLASKDGTLELMLAAPKAPDDTLASIYTRLSADAPNRKITYKAMKADAFFVIAGEEAGRKFYRRYAVGPGAAVRGFLFVYPAARSDELDRVALAIANAFDPFPTGPGAAPVPTPVAGGGPTPAPSPSPAPAGPVLTATALVVAKGQAVTALAEANCPSPTIDGLSVKFLRADPSGLALLGGDFSARPISPVAAGATQDGLVLSLVAAGAKSSLVASDAIVSGSDSARPSLIASLSATARGAPLVDRYGALIGLVAPLRTAPKRAGTVILSEPHEAIGFEALRMLGVGPAASIGGGPVGAAELVRRMRGSVVGVFCGA